MAYSSSLPDSGGVIQEDSFNIMRLQVDSAWLLQSTTGCGTPFHAKPPFGRPARRAAGLYASAFATLRRDLPSLLVAALQSGQSLGPSG